MLSKIALFALVAPLASAFTISMCPNPTSGNDCTITWTTTSTDPAVFTIELLRASFNNAIAIANNVPSSQGTLTLQLPAVPPGDGYTLEAVDISNINNVFAQTGSFSVGETLSVTSTSTTSFSASRPSGTASGSSTASGSGSSSVSNVPISTQTPLTTSRFGTTVSAPATTSGTGTTGANTNSAGSTTGSATSSGTTTPFNAAASLRSSSGYVFLLSALAGAAALVL